MAKKPSRAMVANFHDLHDRISTLGKEWIFRGHANARWKLIPKAGRPPYLGYEEDLFRSWKRQAVEHLSSRYDSDWEWLAIAQHHGLATRLLDWTTNPLNAAYFAVRENFLGPGIIHAVKFGSGFGRSAGASPTEPFRSEGIALFRPGCVVPRIVRQGGVFTIHGPPDTSFERLPPGFAQLETIEIAESYKSKLRSELSHYGINSASLFPDLDGLSSFLNWKVEAGEYLE